MSKYVYLAPTLPKLTDPFWDGLAEIIKDTVGYWREARMPLEERWKECDRGYLAERDLPYLQTMDYIDVSDFGDATIHNAVNNFCIKLVLGMMDKRDQWLTLLGRADENPKILKQVKGEQAWMHRQAGTRRIYAKGVKQAVVRGSTEWFLEWVTRYDYVPISTAKGRKAFVKHLKARGEDPALIRQVKKIREAKVAFNGPCPRVVDTFDVFRNPEQDIVNDFRPSYILRNYIRPHILENSVDDDGENLYENLDGIKATKAGELYYSSDDASRRNRSLKILGLSPSNKYVSADVVPVYVYYAPYLEYDGYEFVDTFFHMALDANNKARIIRIEENPSNSGHNLLVSDTFMDFFTNVAYGMGMVQTVLPAWHQKNFLGALLLNSMASMQAPAMLYQSGALKYDFLDLSPSAINEVMMGMIEAVKPVPMNPAAVQIGIGDQDYFKQSINSTFEVQGGGAPASQQQSDRETATAVNARVSSQGMAIDEHTEKFGPSLQQICQWAYDERIATATPDYQRGDEQFIQYAELDITGKPVPAELNFFEFQRPRHVEIWGSHGAESQQQDAARMIDGMKAFGQMAQYLPNAAALANEMIKEFFRDQEIETEETVWMTPEQIASQDPQVMMMAIEAAFNNPQLMAAFLDQHPDIRAELNQLHGHGPNGPAPQQSPTNGAPPQNGHQANPRNGNGNGNIGAPQSGIV